MIDFKKWRKDKGFTQDEAGAILGRSGDLWGYLEADKQPESRVKAYARVLRAYDNSAERLNKMADVISSQGIGVLISKAESTGLGMKDVAALMGCSTSTVHNLKTGKPTGRVWELSAAALLIEVTDFGWKYAQDPVPVLQDEVLKSVTVPATESTPERVFTPADVIVEVAGEIVSEENSNVFEKVQPVIVDGQPFWVVADVCRAIGHSTTTKAQAVIDEDDLTKVQTVDSVGRNIEQWACNEPGLYTLLLRSNLPKAKAFKKWVTAEVLPSIRKTGGYQTQPMAPTLITALEMQLQAARQLDAQQRQIDAMQAQVKQLSESTVTVEQVAIIASSKTVEAHEKHRSDVYYIHKHVLKAARELTGKVHGQMTAENADVWKAHHVSKIKEINKDVRTAVAKNYACHPKQAPGRDRYSNADKKTAYEALNRWRELNGLQMQLALSLEA